MEEDVVSSPELDVMDQVVDQMQDESVAEDVFTPVAAEKEDAKVPLAALQKMRKRAQEAELKAQWLEQQQMQYRTAAPQAAVEEDNSKYESATKEDVSMTQAATIRAIEERLWAKQNPEKAAKVDEYLPQFLKQRPNLLSAINSSTNRYEEAYTLMEALTPRQQAQMKAAPAPKKDAPGAPTGVPKAASLNQAVDVMQMNDTEFSAWRNQQRKRR